MLPPNLFGAKCLVFGVGVSGTAAACRLLEEGAAVFLEDGDKRRLSAALSALDGARPYGGEEVDYVFRSPGIPLSHPLLSRLRARGARITGETELALSRLPCPVFGVTGSNGKSTVTALAAHLLSAAGHTAHAGGNLGESLLPRLGTVKEDHFAVLELSSFQLEDLTPALARSAILNVAEDHIDYHGSHAAYFAAKRRILSGMRVLPIGEEFAPLVTQNTVLFSATVPRNEATARYPHHPIYLLEDGFVTLCRGGTLHRLFPRSLFPLRGLPFAEDLLAALALCHRLLPVAAMARGAETFTGLAHRVRRVARGGGISFFDSSIDTTPSRTAATLSLFSEKEGEYSAPAVIVSGNSKGAELLPLAEALRQRAAGAVLLGDAILPLLPLLSGFPTARASSMREAITLALGWAKERASAVLLSPGGTSFDLYRDYRERGNDFARISREIASKL